jgi:hypothetical protein
MGAARLTGNPAVPVASLAGEEFLGEELTTTRFVVGDGVGKAGGELGWRRQVAAAAAGVVAPASAWPGNEKGRCRWLQRVLGEALGWSSGWEASGKGNSVMAAMAAATGALPCAR